MSAKGLVSGEIGALQHWDSYELLVDHETQQAKVKARYATIWP